MSISTCNSLARALSDSILNTKLVFKEKTKVYEVMAVDNHIEIKSYKSGNVLDSIMRYDLNATIKNSPTDLNGVVLPHITTFYDDGSICTMTYYTKGKVNRDNDEPAMIKYNQGVNNDTKGYAKIWLKNGNFYERPNGKPNYILKFYEGRMIEKWCMPGKLDSHKKCICPDFSNMQVILGEVPLHRPLNEGPAHIETNHENVVTLQAYHLNGELISKY